MPSPRGRGRICTRVMYTAYTDNRVIKEAKVHSARLGRIKEEEEEEKRRDLVEKMIDSTKISIRIPEYRFLSKILDKFPVMIQTTNASCRKSFAREDYFARCSLNDRATKIR